MHENFKKIKITCTKTARKIAIDKFCSQLKLLSTKIQHQFNDNNDKREESMH